MIADKKRQQAVIDLINEMFVLAGHEVTYEDIKGREDDWYNQWTMTTEQYNQWQDWGKAYLKKKFRWNQKSKFSILITFNNYQLSLIFLLKLKI